MSESIGQHIRKWLRFKDISNKQAGNVIGLSESAFEKLLTKDDILIGRILLLSTKANQNFLEYYYDKQPLNSFRQKEVDEWNAKIEQLQNQLKEKEELLATRIELMETQRKLINELEEKVKRLGG